MKRILILAISLVIGLTSWTQTLSVEDINLLAGQSGYINIQLTTSSGCIAAGFYVELPEQIMVTDDASTAQTGMSSNHIVRMNRLNDNLMRLVVYSADNSVFNFNEASAQPFTLVCLPVKAGSQTGRFAAKLTGIEFAPSPSSFISSGDVNFTITVGGMIGDVNGDGNVSIVDVTMVIDYLLSNDATHVQLDNADVNNDGSISIVDVTKLIDYLLSGSWD